MIITHNTLPITFKNNHIANYIDLIVMEARQGSLPNRHLVDAEGLHPFLTWEVVPRYVTEHKLYLGLVTYYSKFLPDMSTRLALLQLLGHKVFRGDGHQHKTLRFISLSLRVGLLLPVCSLTRTQPY